MLLNKLRACRFDALEELRFGKGSWGALQAERKEKLNKGMCCLPLIWLYSFFFFCSQELSGYGFL